MGKAVVALRVGSSSFDFSRFSQKRSFAQQGTVKKWQETGFQLDTSVL